MQEQKTGVHTCTTWNDDVYLDMHILDFIPIFVLLQSQIHLGTCLYSITAASDKSTARSPRATRKFGRANNILYQLLAGLLRISDFSSLAIVSVSLTAHIQSVNTLTMHSQKHLTHTRIPTSETSDNVSSVTRVTLANQRTGRRNSYIKAESVACQFCRNSQLPIVLLCIHIVHAYTVIC